MATFRPYAKAFSSLGRDFTAALVRRFLPALVLALGGLGMALAATPPNTVINNTASVSFSIVGTPITVTGSASVSTVASTPASIAFMRFLPSTAGLPAGMASVQSVAPTQCNAGAGFSPLPSPSIPGGPVLTVPGSLLLSPSALYAIGDPVFVRVTDYDQNLDPLVAETVDVTLSSNGVDSESLKLTETGPSTGVFIGYIPSSSGAVQPGNCVLNVGGNFKLLATYLDQSAGSIAVTAAALVDPMGLVFDSATGLPVNGAQVTLLDMATGLPAAVLGNDGISTYPSTVISGASVTDSGGTVYVFAAGRYQFPRVAPGNYRLAITPPANYAYPSAAATSALQALPGAPFFIVTGSRAEPFAVLPGPPTEIDVPLDSSGAVGVKLTKSAGKAVVAIGEFVPYIVSISNVGTSPVAALRIADRLPLGFRYQPGSARLENAVLADPSISADGRSLEFSVGTLPGSGSSSLNLRYVAAVLAGARTGQAENTAQASSGATSNIARAAVLVREDLNRSRAILLGRVTLVESCGNEAVDQSQARGLKGVRVMLQDGTYIVTDHDGRWHADNLRPGTHVVQIDETSLPKGLELQACEQNTRTGGRNFSQFVNLRGGTLWRADFRLKRLAGIQNEELVEKQLQPTAQLSPSASRPGAALQLVEILPYDDKWLAAAAPGAEWLHPRPDFVPALPVVKVAIKHAAKHQVELKVNGAAVNALRFDGVVLNPAGTLALSSWRAVELRDGDNLMEVTVRDPQGQVVLQESRSIHYAVGPASAAFDLKHSQLVADGRTPPVVAVRMLDKEGKPVRRGAGGEFQLAAPYLSQDQADAIQREPLTGKLGGRARYQIGDDGVALIALQATTQVGEVVLNFDFGNGRTQEIRAWLTPELRDWVLVGFAEGGVGHKKLSGNMESLTAAGADEQLFDQNRAAFYAKGRVKGEYLLTLAYDSAKEKNAGGSLLNQPLGQPLTQAIDPNQFYTLYGDATQPQFDAASARKLYLKIEKSQFYALFGDYDTGLSVTELGRYSRTLNGIKSEYKGERLGYNGFASLTAQSFRKDEIQGDGTSGLYRLAGRDILVNSDKVRVEVRDRFRPEIIISSKTYTRYLDYQIDYALGTLFFSEPIATRDASFNPVFIVAEYESGGQADARLTYGGRVAVKVGDNPGQKSELGLTHIHEGNLGREATLTGADSTLRFGDSTKLRSELAISQRQSTLGQETGKAYVAELSHVDAALAARAYARQQDAGFGLGQQAGAEAGTRKLGVDARLQLTETLQLQGEAYRQSNLVTDAQREVIEARGQWKNQALTTSAGVRSASETDGKGKDASANQLMAGVGYEMLDKKLNLRASTELDLGSQGSSATFPNRLVLGIDYKVSPQLTVFAQQERAFSGAFKADTTRVGLRTQPWTGGELASSLGNQTGPDGNRLYGNLGLVQKWQINPQWAADFGIDRSQTLGGASTTPFTAAQVPAFGTSNAASSSTASGISTNTTPGTATSLVTGDYTAVFVGAAYKKQDWSGNARLEWRASATDTKVNLLLGAQRNLEDGKSMAAGLLYNRASGTLDSSKVDARLSYAHRPNVGEWIWLDRLQYVQESSQDLMGRLLTRKLINNLNANWMPNRQSQLALQYGVKYVRDSLDGSAYTGVTDLFGVELRQDLGERWDIGLHAGALHSWKSGSLDYHLGVSLGFKVTDNAWLSVGYNQLGFVDADFVGAAYRARGLYLNLRVKFDQDSLNLNERGNTALPRKP